MFNPPAPDIVTIVNEDANGLYCLRRSATTMPFMAIKEKKVLYRRRKKNVVFQESAIQPKFAVKRLNGFDCWAI